MHKWNIEVLRCIKCKGKFKFSEISKNFSILKCSCDQYPLVEGILYLNKTPLKNRALQHLRKREFWKTWITLVEPGLLLLIPASILLFSGSINLLVEKVFSRSIYQIVRFENVIEILTLFSYPKAWAWYVKNRNRMPTYFSSLASTNIFKGNSQTVIDVGCGTGQLLKVFSEKTNPEKVFGVDKSFLSLLLARRFFTSRESLLICADVEKGLPFGNKSIDLILSTDSFHYLKNKGFFLYEASRVLKDRGILAVLHIVNSMKIVFGNVRGIIPQKLSKMLNRAGFKKHMLISNTDMWINILNNTSMNLNSPWFFRNLKYSFAYGFFASRKKLIGSINLTKKEYKVLKKTKIELSQDKELVYELNIKHILNNYDSFIFLSPHLDDAVFSCGYLLDRLSLSSKKVSVITLFTKASGAPFSPQATYFLKKTGFKDADKHFEIRRREDINAIKLFKAKFDYFEFIDAAWRRDLKRGSIYKNDKRQFSGEIAKKDKPLMEEITKTLSSVIKGKRVLIFVPLGIGGHADHIIVRESMRKLGKPTLYWEDYPYNLNEVSVKRFFSKNRLFREYFKISLGDSSKKEKAIRTYKSQLKLHFSNNNIPKIPEKYYITKDSKVRTNIFADFRPE